MAHQIIQQPDGRWSIWSTNVDAFFFIDATKEEIIEFYKEDAAQEAEERALRLFDKIESGGNPYYQFRLTWEEANKKDTTNK